MTTVGSSRKKVIIVDDLSRSQVTFIENILAGDDFEVTAVTRDVEDAIRITECIHPDVVAMRMMMPYIDGCRMLKPMEDRSHAVKVIVTAGSETSPDLKIQLTNLGADVVIDQDAVARNPGGFRAGLGALTSFDVANGRKSMVRNSSVISGQDIFPVPADERRRLETLAALRLGNLQPHPGLDRLVRHLARQTGYPMIAVSVVGAEEIWVKATNGMDRYVVPREDAICAHAICRDKPFQVPDTSADRAISLLPCVRGEPHVRSYVGAPIKAANGVSIGVMCMADKIPRLASRAEIAFLNEAAELAAEFMQQERSQLPVDPSWREAH